MTHHLRAVLALASALALASCATHGRPDRGPGGAGGGRGPDAASFSGTVVESVGLLLADFDADSDRRLTRAELDVGAQGAWAAADRDGDDALSPFEFADWARASMGSETPTPGRLTFDRDMDAGITHEEFIATLNAEFARFDKNQDGVVERAELVRVIQPGRGGAGRGGEGQGPGGGGRLPQGGAGGGMPPGGGFPAGGVTAAD